MTLVHRRSARAFIAGLSLVLGAGLGFLWARSDSGKTPATSDAASPTRLTPPLLTATTPARSPQPVSPLNEAIQRERGLMEIDPAEFPALVEAELRNATSAEAVFRIATAWAERDPDGFLAWLRTKSGSFTLQEAGYGVGLPHTFLANLAPRDPEKAWEAAGMLPGNAVWLRTSVLSPLVNRNPEGALALIRAHRDEVSVMDPGTGNWARNNPTTTLPLIKELLPGRCREAMIHDATSYYLKNPDQIAASKSWFAQLSPELRLEARKARDGRDFDRPDPAARQALLDAWDEVGESGGGALP